MDKYIYLDGVQFEVDTELSQLQRGGGMGAPIALGEMIDQDLYYILLLNKPDKTLFKGSLREAEQSDSVSIIRIPKTVFEEGLWNSDERIRILNHMSRNGVWNILVVDQAHYNRLHGEPPLVDIAGTSFSVDARQGLLSKLYDFDKMIDLTSIPQNQQGRFECYYNKDTFQIYEPAADLQELPKGVVGLVIPSAIEMDPFGVAWQHSRDVISFLLEHPVNAKTFATVIPIEYTELPKLVESNQKVMVKMQRQPQKNINKRKKGKGLK